jgi:hypothetical protein
MYIASSLHFTSLLFSSLLSSCPDPIPWLLINEPDTEREGERERKREPRKVAEQLRAGKGL